jgi:hypothetical protein
MSNLPGPFFANGFELSLTCWNRFLAAFLADAPIPARVRRLGSIDGSIWAKSHKTFWGGKPGNTEGGSIIVPLTSCLTGLDQSVLHIKTKNCQLSYS